MKNWVIVFLIWGTSISLMAQEIEVKGGFISDTVKIGESTDYFLTARYPSNMEILFPDSSFNFQPFEFLKKYYLPSSENTGLVYDSAVYTLTTFELDPWQKLNLPIYLLAKNDSIEISAEIDSIFLQQLVPEATDTTSLIANTDYQKVNTELNLPIVYLAIFILLALSVLFFIFFGKRIGKNLLIRKLKRDYQKFSDQFDHLVASLQKDK